MTNCNGRMEVDRLKKITLCTIPIGKSNRVSLENGRCLLKFKISEMANGNEEK